MREVQPHGSERGVGLRPGAKAGKPHLRNLLCPRPAPDAVVLCNTDNPSPAPVRKLPPRDDAVVLRLPIAHLAVQLHELEPRDAHAEGDVAGFGSARLPLLFGPGE